MKLLVKKVVVTTFATLALLVAVSFPHSTRALMTSLNEGADLFKANCAGCHGEDGKGNTPAGQQLKVRDLQSAEVRKKPDAQLAAVISKGKDKMPPFEKSLSKAQINALIAHIRSLGKK